MSLDREALVERLRQIPYPGFKRDIVSAGAVGEVSFADGVAEVTLELATAPPEVARRIESAVREALAGVEGISEIRLRARGRGGGAPSLNVVPPAGDQSGVAAAGAVDERLIPGVRHVVAVASGKGGVGKSTVAVNLACAAAAAGLRVGLLDADIYGPSIPLLFGAEGEKPEFDAEQQRIEPFERHGVRFMSLGFMVAPGEAVIWRGPMVMKALDQLLRQVRWGELDLLIVDMPPGTGDAQLTMSQRVRLSGAVIVTTPQDLALADVERGIAMFRKVGVDVLGLIENMSYFVCPNCDERHEPFGHGGGRKKARSLRVPVLGELPLVAELRDAADRGTPAVVLQPDSEVARVFHEIAGRVGEALDLEGGSPSSEGGLFERFRGLWPGPGAS